MSALEGHLRSRRLHREVNERIAALSESFALDGVDPPVQMVCECGSKACMATVDMNLSEYHAVRQGPGRWVVSSEHLDRLDGSVLARRNGYALIREVSTSRKEPTSPPTAGSPSH
jgi:hypothetical protein